MMDRRYLYLLQRHPDGKVSLVLCVRVFFAYRKEQKLHNLFSCSRFTLSRRVRFRAWGQDHYKIGIASNVKSRLASINKDLESGKTEWFALTWLEVLFVAGWLLWYKARPYVNAVVIFATVATFVAAYVIEKAPHLLG